MKECANLPERKTISRSFNTAEGTACSGGSVSGKGYTKTTIGEIARVAGFEVLSAEQ